MDASTIETLLESALTANGLAANSSTVLGFLNVTSTALADVPYTISSPLFVDILGLGLTGGNFSLSSVNSTVLAKLITDLAPVLNEIPASTGASIVEYGVAAASTLNLTLSNSTTTALSSYLSTTVLSAVLTVQKNVTGSLIEDGAAVLAAIPQSLQIPYIQKVLLYVGSKLGSVNASSIDLSTIKTLASPYIAEISIPDNVTVPLINNTVEAVVELPSNSSSTFFTELVNFYNTVPKNESQTLSRDLYNSFFPSDGSATTMTNFLLGAFTKVLLFANGNPSSRTGIEKVNEIGHDLFGANLPSQMVTYAMNQQTNLFGDYPAHVDVAPSAIFAAVFMLFGFAHLGVFALNYSRGHKFWLSLAFFFYCIFRFIGWVLRITWSQDLTKVTMGVADEVFLIISSVILITLNLVLAQRIFTWRHPVGGSSKFFWSFMLGMYGLVLGVIAMTIVAQSVPYLYFLSEANTRRYLRTLEASSILLCLYALTAIALVGLAYFFKPTEKDKSFYTYQAWWIEKFSPLYYVEKGASKKAEHSFLERSQEERNAVRVITASTQHHQNVTGVSTDRGALNHTWSILLIFTTSILIFVGAVIRCVTVFEDKTRSTQGSVCDPVVMYICYGLFEVIINILYLVGRVDLRFYRPDRLPKNIRNAPIAEAAVDPSLGSRSDEEKDVGTVEPQVEDNVDEEPKEAVVAEEENVAEAR
ncbi:hypothetical protein CLIB1423_08S04038 [[Candida] railenensis]|uniref:Uncharacterized protein n=1 Tax=[Candida] railenensis TaxID=45579 RepID=A0A9P0VYX1_9ASCO|nr:hypothetical protein CLIB1423_08S04038 [[Candida] railenensis]